MCLEFGAPFCNCAEYNPLFACSWRLGSHWHSPDLQARRESWQLYDSRTKLAYASVEFKLPDNEHLPSEEIESDYDKAKLTESQFERFRESLWAIVLGREDALRFRKRFNIPD